MANIISATIQLDDYECAREILKTLKAPVTQGNIDNLKVIISELGEMYEESYNEMLLKITNDKLASYNTKCECGRLVSVELTKPDFDNITTGGIQ